MRSLNLSVGGVDLVAMIGERDGEDMVAVKPISEALGLAWGAQQQKLSKMRDRLRCIDIDIPSAGGAQKTLCIPVKKVAAWLFTINPNKVKEQYKAAVIAFQDELQYVLYAYVKGDLTFDKIEKLEKLVAFLMGEVERLSQKLQEVTDGTDTIVTHYASAGAHGMLAAKARKKHLRSVPVQ